VNKFTLSAILVAMVGFTGCSSTEKVVTTPSGAKMTASLAAAVNKEQTEELEAITAEFAQLNVRSSQPSLLAAAQGNDHCAAYDRFGDYKRLKARFIKGGFKKSDLPEIDDAVRRSAQQVARVGYNMMAAGKSLSCSGEGRPSEAGMIKEIAGIADEYGQPDDTKSFEPAVFRAAYLRVIKPQVQEVLTEFQKRPDSGDLQGSLSMMVFDAQEWHITPAELGIPANVTKKLTL
jgi:outer membrane murein-binding lipoprotein Lpp